MDGLEEPPIALLLGSGARSARNAAWEGPRAAIPSDLDKNREDTVVHLCCGGSLGEPKGICGTANVHR